MVGLQVEAWLGLAVLTVFGTEWIDLADVKDFAALLTIVVLALAYVLGIIADRLADTVLDWLEKTKRGKRIKRSLSKNRPLQKPARLSEMRMRVMHESEGMSRFLDYQRSRWRVARGTVVNLAAAGPIAALYLVVRTDEHWLWVVVPLACSVVLVPLTYFAGVRVQDAWVGRLVDAYAIIKRRPPK